MKNTIIILTLAVMLFTTKTTNAQLSINIKNISSNIGNIYIAIYNSEETYMDIPSAITTKIISIVNNKVSYTFNDLPKGNYSITVFHDKNENEILDTNFFGIPKEDYGFSNNARGVLKAPTFEETNFIYNGNKTIQIEVK